MTDELVDSVDAESMSVLLGAIAERTGHSGACRQYCGAYAVISVAPGGQTYANPGGKTPQAAVLRCWRHAFGVEGYRGGKATDQLRRIARDIRAGVAPPAKAKRKERKRVAMCPHCKQAMPKPGAAARAVKAIKKARGKASHARKA